MNINYQIIIIVYVNKSKVLEVGFPIGIPLPGIVRNCEQNPLALKPLVKSTCILYWKNPFIYENNNIKRSFYKNSFAEKNSATGLFLIHG